MMKKIFFFCFLISLSLLTGCVKNNPDPSWIEINGFTVQSNPQLSGSEGDLSRNALTNGWVYINDKFIGIFELPCKIPVMVQGQSAIRVYPTILNNGISLTKKQYPFLEAYETIVDLKQNETVVIAPTTKYLAGTKFWVEDFEGSTQKLTQGNGSQTNYLVQLENGNRYGRVLLTPSESYWAMYTDEEDPFSFPIGSSVYLEAEFYCTSKVITSVLAGKLDGTITEHVNVSMLPSNSETVVWKKIYIDLTDVVKGSGGYKFWQAFSSQLPEGSSQSLIYLDNIKVVYR